MVSAAPYADRVIGLDEITPEGMKILREKYHEDPYELIESGYLTEERAFYWERNHFDTHKEEMPQDCEEEREKAHLFSLYLRCLRWWAKDEVERKDNPRYGQKIQNLWKSLDEEKKEFEQLHKLYDEDFDEYVWQVANRRLKFFYGIETREQYYQYRKDHSIDDIDFSTYQPIFKLKSNEELDRERRKKHVKR